MSRGILHQSESDWGEFLLTFELGLMSRLTQHPLLQNVNEVGARAFFQVFQGPLSWLLSLAPVLEKAHQGKTGQDKTGQHLNVKKNPSPV